MSEKVEKKDGRGRTRNFASVIYPDSAPANWLDILSDTHIPVLISPLHDKDVNPTGEPKKPHYHVLLAFDSVKTVEQAVQVFELIGGVGCEIIKSFRSYARYLCHLDNPDKEQYDINSVKCFGGINYFDIISCASDRYLAFGEMMDFCVKYNVTSFYLLTNYARLNRPDWFRILCDSGTIFIKEFLKSLRWSMEHDQLHIVDTENGDIIL